MSYWHVIGGFAAFLALVWLIVRQAWISRVTVTIEAEAVSVAMPHARTKRIRWADLATSQYIAPQLASLQLLMLRPEFGKRAGRLPGFDARSQLRRVVTQSPELLLIARDGVFLLIPLAAVTSFEWSQLRAAAQRHSPSPEVYRAAIEQARECEEAAQERMIATQWAEAVPLYRQAAVHWERSGRIEQVNRTLENLATCLVHLGQYTAAAGVFQRALSLCEALEDEAGAAFVHNGLGGVEAALGEAGNLEAAIAHLRAARRIHASFARGGSYTAQEARFFEARTVSNQASVQERLAMLKRIDDPAAAGEAIVECERLANEALALLQPLSTVPLPDLHGQRANLHGTLARCAALRGEWDRAATLFAAAADESQERAILADRALWARAELMRSRAPGLDPVVSRRLIHEAMRRIDEAVRMSPLQGSQDDLLEIITTRGGLFWEMQRWDEAARDYDYALRLIDDRPHNFSRPAERAALRRRFHELYPRLVEANLRLALQSPHNAEQAIAWAFQASERFKSTSLAEILASEAMLGLLADETRRELEEAQRRQREAMLEGESLRSVTDDGTRGAIWRRMWDADER
ncbi:MAG TPA: tetratricopeptide repeat protein, partial [Thermoanaerobaculia bacterium]|nr:tetratricopeptide repeat protein [Thermoanaerobaculia bacterium]